MPPNSADTVLFPPLSPYRSGMLPVDATHTLYWEECGNPDGIPVLFLHGGPGGGCSPTHRRFFDPAHYRIVLFDQRGAGKSTPAAELKNNTTALLIDDIEMLRRLLEVDQWLVFGGSWGATLALAYGQTHPQRCLGFVLRGIFLCTQAEIAWFLHGMARFFPQAHQSFVAQIPIAERADLLQAYAKRLFSADPQLSLPAARRWAQYEAACSYLHPRQSGTDEVWDDQASLKLARLEAHYLSHGGFMDDDQLINNMARIAHLPVIMVQGQYDVVCPPATAYRLQQAWAGAKLQLITDAGHAALEPGTAAALVAATEQFRHQRCFD